jgi:hypothetical protein
MFGDNQAVVNNSAIPHLCLSKRHNALSYHRVREAIAAKVVNYYWENGKHYPADIVSKHWAYPQIWHMLQPFLFYSGDAGNLNKENTRSKFGKDWTSRSEDTADENTAEKGGKREELPQVVLN